MHTRSDRVRGLNRTQREPTFPVFGLGCFWGAEAVFGALPGVLRTRVGYAGGTIVDPTHFRIGDHIEVVEVEFDPARLTFAGLLTHFFANHDAARNPGGRRPQHRSAIGCEESWRPIARAEIRAEARRRGRKIHTILIEPRPFYVADARHQKWHLQRLEPVWDALLAHFGDEWTAIDSTVATRLNAYVRGHGQLTQLLQDLARWPLPADARRVLVRAFGADERSASP